MNVRDQMISHLLVVYDAHVKQVEELQKQVTELQKQLADAGAKK